MGGSKLIRGTTPTHIYELPIDENLIQKLHISYAQRGVVILTKTEADCTFENGNAVVKLTQEDTLLFDSQLRVEIQMRILTIGEDALASSIYYTSCATLLENEVI